MGWFSNILDKMKDPSEKGNDNNEKLFQLFKNNIQDRHWLIVNDFKKNGFGTNMPILSHLSILKPIDRCIILEKLFDLGIQNIYLFDKIVLAYVKIDRPDLGKKVIEWVRSIDEYRFRFDGMETKLTLGVPNETSNQERINKIYSEIDNCNSQVEYEFLLLLLRFIEMEENKVINYQRKIADSHIKKFSNFVETKYPLKIRFHDVIELRNAKEIKIDVDSGKIKGEEAFKNYYAINEEKCYAIYNYLYTFDIPRFDFLTKKVFICWIAIERDDWDNLISPNGEAVMDIWDLTEVLQEVLQRFVLDVGAEKEGDTYFRKFSWILIV